MEAARLADTSADDLHLNNLELAPRPSSDGRTIYEVRRGTTLLGTVEEVTIGPLKKYDAHRKDETKRLVYFDEAINFLLGLIS